MDATPTSTLLLVIEDSLDDFKAMLRAFKKSGLANPVVHFQLGEEALEYLQARGKFRERRQLPALILLDLNLPGIDGHQVLAQIKQNPELRSIPIVILTTSDNRSDIERCYDAGANTYIRKPVTLQGLVRAMEEMKQYWFEIALLPNSERMAHDGS